MNDGININVTLHGHTIDSPLAEDFSYMTTWELEVKPKRFFFFFVIANNVADEVSNKRSTLKDPAPTP